MTSSTISRPLISGCVRPSHKDEGSNQSQHPHLLGVLLASRSCGQGLWLGRTPVRSKRATNMTKQITRGPGERIEVRSGISEQRLKVSAVMIMRHNAA